jgi:hypothetical protein
MSAMGPAYGNVSASAAFPCLRCMVPLILHRREGSAAEECEMCRGPALLLHQSHLAGIGPAEGVEPIDLTWVALNSPIVNCSSSQVVAANTNLAMNLALWLSGSDAVQ